MNKIILEDAQQISKEIAKEVKILEGKTMLVAGGSGFLGGYFLDVVSFLNENFLKKPCYLICLDNLITSNQKRVAHLLSKKYFKFIEHNISEPFIYQDRIDFIVHSASIASPTFYRQYPLETIEVNTLGTRNLLQLAVEKKIKSFLYLSSSEIYGDPLPENIPTPETYRGNVSCTGPRACYAESKRLAETLCMIFFNKYQVPVKIVRPFNVYGPGLRLEDKRVISDFLGNILKGEPIIIHSKGNDTRSFCYVSDACSCFFKILLSDFNGEVFNVGNDLEETSIRELAETVKKLFSDKVKVEIVQKISDDPNYLKDNPHRRSPDLTKIRKFLKYEPKVSLKEGLQRLMEWYKAVYPI